MKQMRSTLLGLAVCGLVLGLVSAVDAQQVLQGKVTVVRKKGEARYTDGKHGWKMVKVGDVYAAGTIVQTEQAKGAYVDLVLGDPFAGPAPTPVVFNPSAAASAGAGGAYAPNVEQNVVRLWENTMVGVDKLTSQQTGAEVVTETQLDLKAGHILGMVKKMSRASKYEIKLPNGVAGIRGTLYELWANGSGMVSAGSMIISLLDSQQNPVTTVLNGDERFDSSTGAKSPISDAMRLAFDKAISDIKVAPVLTPPPAMAPDGPTIEFVSPTKGKGKHKGNGNGNGGGVGSFTAAGF